MNEIKLERMTLEYVNVSPFKLQRVAQAERARYIKKELDDVAPTPPTYTAQYGGGALPDGTALPSWEESYDYTTEYILQLNDEYESLEAQPPTPTTRARMAELHAILETWRAYVGQLSGLNGAMRLARWNAGLWHAFKDAMPNSDDWIKEQGRDGIDISKIPEDERERLVYWLETEAVSTQDEYNLLVYTIDQDERMIKVAEARIAARQMFQHPVESDRADD